MPKVLLGRDIAEEKFMKAMKKGMIDKDIPQYERLADKIGLSRNTFMRYRKEPGLMSIYMIRKLVKMGIITIEDVEEFIKEQK